MSLDPRLTEGVHDGEARLKLILDAIPNDLYEAVVVDYGSPVSMAASISTICSGRESVTLVRVDDVGDLFSIGAARDIGVQHSKTPIVMFNDVDFYASTQMYLRIHQEVSGRCMTDNSFDFFCIPVMWITEAEMPNFNFLIKNNSSDQIHYRYHSAATERNNKIVETVAYGSSAIVVSKNNYLSIGGHNKRFSGHGAEDYDLLHRLSHTFPRGPRTGNYYHDTKSNEINKYEGFRAFFATYGIDIFNRGLFFIHMWHPRRVMPNYFQSSRNFQTLAETMAEFDKSDIQPFPLSDLTTDKKTLILVDPTARVSKSFRYALPHMGDYTMMSEQNFADPSSLLEYTKRNYITNIGFLNPYGNDHRLALYHAVRKASIPYWTFDRGALPDSWFFDRNGFNADSSTYHADAWDKPLSGEDIILVEDHCAQLRTSDATLEKNGARIGSQQLRDMFGLSNQKVIFVPLQRPKDTVIRYFAGPVEDQRNFVRWVGDIAEKLDPSEYVIVVKKHPLEEKFPKIPNVYFAPEDTHVHDLLELCDKVLLINSGTGVLSMIFRKPVVYCGTPFYPVDGVNYGASTVDEAFTLVSQTLSFNRDKANSFLHHLLTRVYSFAQASYDTIKKEDGASITIVKRLLFSELRGLTDHPVILGQPKRGISLDAPLFACFGGRPGIMAGVKMPSVRAQVFPKQRIKQTPKRIQEQLPPSGNSPVSTPVKAKMLQNPLKNSVGTKNGIEIETKKDSLSNLQQPKKPQDPIDSKKIANVRYNITKNFAIPRKSKMLRAANYILRFRLGVARNPARTK